MKGYKAMISDNIPRIWDLALRWCKCRTKWIDYVYDSYIKPLNTNVMATKGSNNRMKSELIKRYTSPKKTSFIETIKTCSLLVHDPKEHLFWNNVNTWVNWFAQMEEYVYSTADICLNNKGWSVEDTVKYTAERYGVKAKVVLFVMKERGLC